MCGVPEAVNHGVMIYAEMANVAHDANLTMIGRRPA